MRRVARMGLKNKDLLAMRAVVMVKIQAEMGAEWNASND